MRRFATVLMVAATLLMFTGMAVAQNMVTFQVDMSVQINGGNFNPASDSVVVRGSFNGWGGNAALMTDTNNDSIFDVTVDIPGVAGDTVFYKYVMTKANSGDVWESIADNRFFLISGGAQTLAPVFWDNNPGGADIDAFFFCDMTVPILSGQFDPANDIMDVRGAFNGWSAGNTMSQDIFNTNLFTGAFQFMQIPTNQDQEYKFTYTPNGGGTVWEEPNQLPGRSNNNRFFVVTGNEPDADNNGFLDVVTDTVFFGDITPNDIFTSPTDIFFEVDMRPAFAFLAVNDTIFNLAGPHPFETSIDSVYLSGSPSQGTTPDLNWVWDNSNIPSVFKPLQMMDDGTGGDQVAGDSVYTLKVTFNAGAAKSPVYKYGFNLGDNEAGFGKNHKEDVSLDPGGRHRDEFGETDTLYSKVYTAIDHNTNSVPKDFELFQNYPNPFNPTTKIQFALVKSTKVKLLIYNVLGQKVRTLINGQIDAGVHTVVWDGRNDAGQSLGSGVYFYRVQTDKFSKTRKMILMK